MQTLVINTDLGRDNIPRATISINGPNFKFNHNALASRWKSSPQRNGSRSRVSQLLKPSRSAHQLYHSVQQKPTNQGKSPTTSQLAICICRAACAMQKVTVPFSNEFLEAGLKRAIHDYRTRLTEHTQPFLYMNLF